MNIETKEPGNVLYRIKRGLAGYVSYLAACDMNDAFSEYVLYEPILRILTARAFTAHCEVVCPGVLQQMLGDRPRLDFEAIKGDTRFALEVKWARATAVNVARDYNKLLGYRQCYPLSEAFLCVFGRKTYLEKLRLRNGRFHERGKAIYADLRRTKYGCRVYEISE